MNNYYNTYTYELFKLLHSLNTLNEEEIIIGDKDMEIIGAYYDELKDLLEIDFDTFLSIVKKLSVNNMKVPVNIAWIIYNELKIK